MTDEEIKDAFRALIDTNVECSIWTEDQGKAAHDWLDKVRIGYLAMNQLMAEYGGSVETFIKETEPQNGQAAGPI
jgi:hypothetical protein